jgi:hypothetical protein
VITAQIDLERSEIVLVAPFEAQTAAGVLVGPAVEAHIPIREVRWMDERSSCALAHEALAPDYLPGEPNPDAALPAFRECPAYRAGRCALAHDRAACLFAELPDSAGWATVRKFRRLPDGTVCTAESYAELRPIIEAQRTDPAYRALPDGTYCLAEYWETLNAMLTRR